MKLIRKTKFGYAVLQQTAGLKYWIGMLPVMEVPGHLEGLLSTISLQQIHNLLVPLPKSDGDKLMTILGVVMVLPLMTYLLRKLLVERPQPLQPLMLVHPAWI